MANNSLKSNWIDFVGDYIALIKKIKKNIFHANYKGSKTAVLQLVLHDDHDQQSVLSALKEDLDGTSVYLLKQNLYVVLMNSIVEAKEAALVAHEIIFNSLSNHKVSIGIAVYPLGGQTEHDLMTNAAQAVDIACDVGAGVFRFYKSSRECLGVERRKQLETEVKSALANHEFFIQYQPKISLSTNKITGCEALIRWRHPSLGLINPDEFIPLIAHTDFIFDVGQWVLEHSMEDFSSWKINGPFRLSVNLAPKQLTSYYIAELILSVLERYQMKASNLSLEITENEMLDDIEANKKKLSMLVDHDVQILVDDYGTGFASLTYLQKLPIDGVKLDKTFVSHIECDKLSQVIVKSSIEMAQALGFYVIAEGVETEAQMALLRSFGCEEVQGFFTSPPLNNHDFYNFYLKSLKSKG